MAAALKVPRTSLLDRAPPLTGGRERFDPQWLRSLPADGALALAYPPHVQLVRDGYQICLGGHDFYVGSCAWSHGEVLVGLSRGSTIT